MVTAFARVFKNWHFCTPVVAVIQYKSLTQILQAGPDLIEDGSRLN